MPRGNNISDLISLIVTVLITLITLFNSYVFSDLGSSQVGNVIFIIFLSLMISSTLNCTYINKIKKDINAR